MARKSKIMNDDSRKTEEDAPPSSSEELKQEEELQTGVEDVPAAEFPSEKEEDSSRLEEESLELEGDEDGPGAEGESVEDADPELAPDPPVVDELEEAREELRVLRDRHLRLAADFENYKKRVSADLAGGWVRAQAELVRSLTEGLDDLQRVSQFTSEDTTVDVLVEGVDLVERKLLKALTDAGLTVLDPQDGPFDPNIMEAMMRVPSEKDGQDDTVHQVFQKGYLFKDRLVRPARVSVYKDDD